MKSLLNRLKDRVFGEDKPTGLDLTNITGETPYDTARQVINTLGYEPKRTDRKREADGVEIYYRENESCDYLISFHIM